MWAVHTMGLAASTTLEWTVSRDVSLRSRLALALALQR